MKHPFAKEPIEKKYTYVLGIAMVAFENGKIDSKQKIYLNKLIQDIELTNQDLDSILKLARQYQIIKNKVVSVLDTPQKKYCFLMELYSMFHCTKEEPYQWMDGIEQFTRLLDITETEHNRIKQSYKMIEHKNKKYFENIDRKYDDEEHFLGNLTTDKRLEETSITEIKEVTLEKGDTLHITKDCKITEIIRVLEGASLSFEDVQVEMHAPIQVKGGRLSIKNTLFKCSGMLKNTMFVVEHTNVSITNSSFDGNSTTSIWCQTGGELLVADSIFTQTAYRPAIALWDCPASIKDSMFRECKAENSSGGAIYTNSNIEVTGCQFEACSAYKGAVLYRFAAIIPWVGDFKEQNSCTKGKAEKDNGMVKIFGKRVSYIPIPKSFKRISYPVVLKNNHFVDCKGYRMGVICAYKSQVVINEKNTFDKCDGQEICYYE